MDEQGQPLVYVNVFIKGTTDGTSSSEQGRFSFSTETTGTVTLCALQLGYETFTHTCPVEELSSITIRMEPSTLSMDEVVVQASYFMPRDNSFFSGISPIDIATTAGAAGNLYGALQALPGVQQAGESGKLLVRGGDSRETQTYIDDMHVMSPYTTTGVNVPARGRYSPFLFEGINLSTGAYQQEYADGLSGVLPLYTKDVSGISKFGINPSTVGLAGGGTSSFDKGSFSTNMDYLNLGPYQAVFPDRINWTKPYQQLSSANQFRLTPNDRTVFKTYAAYDYTAFGQGVEAVPEVEAHEMNLRENNLYANSTFRRETSRGYQLFAGGAFAFKEQHVDGAVHRADTYTDRVQELHVKMKLSKRFSRYIQLGVGAESFVRHYQTHYVDSTSNRLAQATPSLHACFAIANVHLVRNLNMEVSTRMENHVLGGQWILSPRIGMMYAWHSIHFSAAAGRYTQQADNLYLLQNSALRAEECVHYVAGVKYQTKGRIYRAEVYYKQYDHLALEGPQGITSTGYGYGKGVDLFFSDQALLPNLEYQLSYSFNLSERKYRAYQALTISPYLTRHNASLLMKYTFTPLKSSWGITYRFASGRPYHDPERAGIMNAFTKCYRSVDMCLTVLATKRLIVHASASNILGAKQVFGKVDGVPVRASSDHFFYLGVFISLGGKAAYDVSNF